MLLGESRAGNMKQWYPLNIDNKNAINTMFDFEYLKQQRNGNPNLFWFFTNNELPRLFNNQWLDYMKSLNLEIESCLLFYRYPHNYHPTAHIDLDMDKNNGSTFFGINWVLGPDDSKMFWYNTPNNFEPIVATQLVDSGPETESAEMKYAICPMDKLTGLEIDSVTVGTTPTLVHAGILHNVQTHNTDRWSLSLRVYRDNNVTTWEDAVDYFKDYIVC